MSYATLAQLRAALRLTDTIDDSLLTLALDSASEQIDAWCGRTFGTAGTATTRYYPAYRVDQVEVDDMAEAPTSVLYSSNRDGTYDGTVPLTSIQCLPVNGISDGLSWPYTSIRILGYSAALPISYGGEPTVAVTAKFAFGSIPTAVTQAAILQASRVFTRNQSPFGVVGFGDLGVVRIAQGLDVDVQMLLQPYRKVRAAL